MIVRTILPDNDILRTAGVNALIVGADEVVDQLLAELRPSANTLVIRHVDRLSASQQQQLLCRLEGADAPPRVLATTAVPLFELVTAGLFSEVLYYRLNTVLVDLRHPIPADTMVERIRGEYLEMPGLQLTVAQAQRLCGIEQSLCKTVLDALVDAKFLSVKPNGAYVRLTDGEMPGA
jgi:sigma-54-interacting transcriptional regulator